MLVSFDEIIDITLKHEGGYVHDPKDLGGETNFGIAKRFYPDVDIKNLSKDEAKDIYRRDYWDRNKIEELDEELRHIFFDMCVNQGRGTAVKILQRACNAKGADLAVDGGWLV
jgi:lysozyme family protein